MGNIFSVSTSLDRARHFSTITRAEEFLLKDVRNLSYCIGMGFLRTIICSHVDYPNEPTIYKYNVEIKDRANLRFLHIEFPDSRGVFDEVIHLYYSKDEYSLFYEQVSRVTSVSRFGFVYFNDRKIFTYYKRELKHSNTFDKVETVKEEKIRDHLKFRVFVDTTRRGV